MLKKISLLAFCLILAAGAGFAQQNVTSKIVGKVKDDRSPAPRRLGRSHEPQAGRQGRCGDRRDGHVPPLHAAFGHVHHHLHAAGLPDPSSAKASCCSSSRPSPSNITLKQSTLAEEITVVGQEPADRRQDDDQGLDHDQGGLHAAAPQPQLRRPAEHGARRPVRRQPGRPVGRRRLGHREHVVHRRHERQRHPRRPAQPEHRHGAAGRGQGYGLRLQRRVRRLDGRRRQRHQPLGRQRVPRRPVRLLQQQQALDAGQGPRLPAAGTPTFLRRTWPEYVNDDDLYFGGGKDRDDYQRFEGVFNLGGYIIKDRLWFFGSFNPVYARTYADRWFRTDPVDLDQAKIPGDAVPRPAPGPPALHRLLPEELQLQLAGQDDRRPVQGHAHSAERGQQLLQLPRLDPLHDRNGNEGLFLLPRLAVLARSDQGHRARLRLPEHVGRGGHVDYTVSNNFLVSVRGGFFRQNTTNQQLFVPGTYYAFDKSNMLLFPGVIPDSQRHDQGWSNGAGTPSRPGTSWRRSAPTWTSPST